jgi:hypothetical protein
LIRLQIADARRVNWVRAANSRRGPFNNRGALRYTQPCVGAALFFANTRQLIGKHSARIGHMAGAIFLRVKPLAWRMDASLNAIGDGVVNRAMGGARPRPGTAQIEDAPLVPAGADLRRTRGGRIDGRITLARQGRLSGNTDDA